MNEAHERGESIEGGNWDAYDCNEYDDCNEPFLIPDLLFATRLGMTKMIELLLPLTVRLCQQGGRRLLARVHAELKEMNCRIACEWAALAFKNLIDD